MTVDIPLKQEYDNSYTITIDALKTLHFDTKVAVITNPKVAGLHLKKLLECLQAMEVIIITVPDGEQYKNQETLSSIHERLFDHKFDRKSLLIAFGGGVIGDMTGFAAATFQRGIDFIQIPTTLLSQVDASVGGKTGINNRYGKNLVGAFHQPKAVYIDPSMLKTLPKREFAAGVAEIIKMAVTFDGEFFEYLQRVDLRNDEEALKEAIRRAVSIKAGVVAQDEKEKGLRAAFNYGHTFGHVIENETGYSTYLHGEAVAIGMEMANLLAIELDLMSEEEADSVRTLLEKYGHNLEYAIEDIDAFYEAFFLDKKSANNTITFIVPEHIGGVQIRNDIEESNVKKVLQRFAR